MQKDQKPAADQGRPSATTPVQGGNFFARLNERGKVLNDVKVNVVTVIIFICCLGVITAIATSLAYVTHLGVKGIEHNRN
jgi:hypothetical protein